MNIDLKPVLFSLKTPTKGLQNTWFLSMWLVELHECWDGTMIKSMSNIVSVLSCGGVLFIKYKFKKLKPRSLLCKLRVLLKINLSFQSYISYRFLTRQLRWQTNEPETKYGVLICTAAIRFRLQELVFLNVAFKLCRAIKSPAPAVFDDFQVVKRWFMSTTSVVTMYFSTFLYFYASLIFFEAVLHSSLEADTWYYSVTKANDAYHQGMSAKIWWWLLSFLMTYVII